MTVSIIILIALAILFFGWRFFNRVPRPEFPPINVAKDDPAMIAAMEEGKSKLGEFIKLLDKYPNQAMVKVPFHTSDGETEYLWAEVKRKENEKVYVFLITPPITHTGTVDRNQEYSLRDIVDWSLTDENGKIIGGFTMKVMFNLAREKWGELPKKLQEEERKYV